MPEATENTPPPPALTGAGATTHAQNDWSAAKTILTPFPASETVQEIVYALVADDLSAAQSYLMSGGKGGVSRLWLLIPLVVIVVLALSGRPSGRSSGSLTSLLLPMLFPLILVLVITLLLLRFQIRSVFKKIPGSEEPRRVRLTPDYLEVQDQVTESRVRWHGIARIDEGKKHFFIRFHTNMAMPIPRRAFETDAAGRAFFEEMTRLWQRAGGGGKPSA